MTGEGSQLQNFTTVGFWYLHSKYEYKNERGLQHPVTTNWSAAVEEKEGGYWGKGVPLLPPPPFSPPPPLILRPPSLLSPFSSLLLPSSSALKPETGV